MDLSNILNIFNSHTIEDVFFKVTVIIFALLYFLYAMVISKQVNIMDKTLEDKHNWLISLITSLQVTASLILLILAIFLA